MRILVLLCCALLAAWPAMAERIRIRSGEHAGYGRVVFDWPSAPPYTLEQQGQIVTLRFRAEGELGLEALRSLPRNFRAARPIQGGIEFELAPGARARHFRNGPKVAVDAVDGEVQPAAATSTARAAPAPRSAPPAPLAPTMAEPVAAPAPVPAAPPEPSSARAEVAPVPLPAAPAAAPADPPAAPAAARADPALPAAERPADPPRAAEIQPAPPVPAAPAPAPSPAPRPAVVLAAAPAAPPALPPLPAVVAPPSAPVGVPAPPAPRRDWLLPYPAETGAAMLRRGDTWLAVFDAPSETMPESLLRAGWRYSTIPGGSLLTTEDERPWHLRRNGARWSLVQGQPVVAQAPIQAVADGAGPGQMVLAVRAANRSLSVQDPVSGLPLLLGTVRQDGAQLTQPRRFVDLGLLETRLGVALLAYSDAVLLRPGQDRFVVQGDGNYRLVMGEGALTTRSAAVPPPGISRSFDFPQGPLPDLSQRLRAQQAGIAQAAALSRGAPRLAAAETLLALGQPQEAQSLIALALEQDPIVAAQPRAAWLLGAAALAAGRIEEAENLGADPISDETALWRGLYLAQRGEPAAAAPLIARGAALLPSYPDALRQRLLPRAVEALAAGGQPAIADDLLRQADAATPGLELGRAILAEQRGDQAAALDAYDALVQGRDRRMRAEALRRAAELRIASGALSPLEGARALERTLFAWREGDEVSTRRRIAELRRRGGDGQGALALLRETEALFPEAQPSLQPDMDEAFLATLRQESAVNAVALYDAYPELLPRGARGEEALALLAERMVSLDLADRATTMLRQALERPEAAPRRAGIGSRLAAVRLAERDAGGALSALAETETPEIPPELRQERALLAARAQVQRGAEPRAAFGPLGPAGQEALAEALSDARDFAGAAEALGQVLERELAGQAAPLPAVLARKVIRHAALLALAGDTAGLGRARDAHAPLLAGGPAEAPFRVLTTDPIRGLMDLPRLQNELELFRALPSRLEGLRTAEASTR